MAMTAHIGELSDSGARQAMEDLVLQMDRDLLAVCQAKWAAASRERQMLAFGEVDYGSPA
jgi:hypothetical protein